MKIVIAGATGFIGSALSARLKLEHEVTVLSRDPTSAGAALGVPAVGWNGDWRAVVAAADAVVNLAGASLAGRRWNAAYKEEIRASRLEPTAQLVSAMRGGVLVGASAVGYYGDTGDAEVAE